MHYTYKPEGVCSTFIEFDIINNKLTNVKFTNGCSGNLKAVSKLVEGEAPERIASLLEGNTCGNKKTSCADQFSKAIKKAIEKDLQ